MQTLVSVTVVVPVPDLHRVPFSQNACGCATGLDHIVIRLFSILEFNVPPVKKNLIPTIQIISNANGANARNAGGGYGRLLDNNLFKGHAAEHLSPDQFLLSDI